MLEKIPIITIDGLGGSGKTSVASQLASDLGWHVLYSGLLYRYLAYCQKNMRFAMFGDHQISGELRDSLLNLRCRVNQSGDLVCLLANEDLSAVLSTESVARDASLLAGIPQIRQQLLEIQHRFVRAPGLIAEGRDMARVVFPSALVSIYLFADEEVRVQRRFIQLNRCGNDVKIDQVALMQSRRDARDRAQAFKKMDERDGVIALDTSKLSMDAVKARIYRALSEKGVTVNQPIDAIA